MPYNCQNLPQSQTENTSLLNDLETEERLEEMHVEDLELVEDSDEELELDIWMKK